MVRLVFPPHGTIPRNESEIRLIQFLLENLSSGSSSKLPARAGNAHSSFTLISNLEIEDIKTRAILGIDAILVAPHAVYLIEVRDWGPHIRIGGQFWTINAGRERRNPHSSLEYKCRALHSLIGQANPEIAEKTWCEGLVALVCDGVQLDLTAGCHQNTFLLDAGLIAFLKDPNRLSSPERIPDNALAPCHRELADIILAKISARKYRQFRILDYMVEEILEIQPGYAEYLAIPGLDCSSSDKKRLRVFTLPDPPLDLRTALRDQISEDYKTFESIAANENLVGFKAFVEDQENRIVEVLDWAEERTLYSVTADNRLTFEQKIGIVKGIGGGIRAFHERGIVHRNITPENILVTSSGPRILNFHLSTLKEKGYLVPGPGLLNGLNRRYAPCDLNALRKSPCATAAADLYSLGAIFYELLCGDVPYTDSDEFGKAGGRLTEVQLPSKRVPELPGWVDEAVQRLYTLNHQDQFQSIASFLDSLDSLAKGHGQHEKKKSLPSPELPAPEPTAPLESKAPVALDCRTLFKIPGEIAILGANGFEKIASLFQDADLDSQLDEGRPFSKLHLVNLLNYVNFQDGTILINLINNRYKNIISVEAKPQPCSGGVLECVFTDEAEVKELLPAYDVSSFLVSDGDKMILVKPSAHVVEEGRIIFNLPEDCSQFNFKRSKRHLCENIQAEFIQNGLLLSGSLLDFCNGRFRIELSLVAPQTFQWINADCPATLIIKDGGEVFYSGECRILRQGFGQKKREFTLEAVCKEASRFKRKEYRSPRHILTPSPNAVFRHPLTGKMVNLEIEDISGSGFSVEEYSDSSVLFPGLIIPDVDVEFGGGSRISCKAQVVYKRQGETKKTDRCGLAILDMSISDQTRLASILHQASRKRSYICNRVDLDALWKFFFEASFVYPQKYVYLHQNKEKFKELYTRLYSENLDLAKHFIYQEKGIIYGHISMIHFYENTWMLHHHAATGPKSKKGGLIVLDQIGRFVNDIYNMYSSCMSFVACYFRPENKFPNRVFGGFADHLNDNKRCSCDDFAYLHLPKGGASLHTSVEELRRQRAMLQETSMNDILELESFYENQGGGLMLSALDLRKDSFKSNTLSTKFEELGFKRERHLFSLKKDNRLAAIFICLVSDIGLNLSNLTNCVHVILMDCEGIDIDLLNSALHVVMSCSNYINSCDIPVAITPIVNVSEMGFQFDKTYRLWVFDVSYMDSYLKYMESLVTRHI